MPHSPTGRESIGNIDGLGGGAHHPYPMVQSPAAREAEMWSSSVTYIEDLGVERIWPNSDTQMAGGCADGVVSFEYILKYTPWDLMMD